MDFIEKSLDKRETGKRLTTEQVIAIVVASSGDAKVKERAAKIIRALRAKSWVELSFPEAEKVRRFIVANDLEPGAPRATCCPTYHDAMNKTLAPQKGQSLATTKTTAIHLFES